MQTSVPDAMDISEEPDHILRMYGKNSYKPGTYAANCLLARRLIEKDVRFVQLYHTGWDQHDNLPSQIKRQAEDVDQGTAALIMDLKQRGLLEDTLVIWGGEFGRTPTVELPKPGSNAGKVNGRDHNHHGFTVWMAGGGVKPGHIHGATDPFGFQAIEKPVHVHDLHATMLHCFGLEHEQLTYRFQGRDFRLTDVGGEVIKDWLA